jgi:diguanylate cyclase (GGDEF)-like protein
MQRALRDGLARFEWEHYRADGRSLPVEVTLARLELQDHAVLYCVWRDITDRKQAEEEAYQLAFFDPLTGLPNRRLLHDRLQQSMAASARSGKYRALLYLDLDHFKNLNDTHGHAMGDRLLIEMAQRLRTCVREGDTVARLGGDEFVLLVQQLDEDLETAVAQAGRIGDKVVAQLSQPCAIGAVQYQGSASVGVSMFLGHALDLDEILKRADLAMYQAKAAGRNTVRFSIRRSRRASMPAPHWKRTCARPYNATSWCCTTSPRWTPRAAVWVWRPWCAGNTRSAGRCSRWTSFRWPRRRG